MEISLIDQISDQHKIVFWPSNSALTKNTIYFKDYDYICDGLISEIINESNFEQKNSEIISFRTNHFNSALWIIFIGPKTTSSAIDEQINTLIESINHSNELIIAGEKTKWDEELPRRYTQFKFKII